MRREQHTSGILRLLIALCAILLAVLAVARRCAAQSGPLDPLTTSSDRASVHQPPGPLAPTASPDDARGGGETTSLRWDECGGATAAGGPPDRCASAPHESFARLQLWGERHSGTNLLQSHVERNFLARFSWPYGLRYCSSSCLAPPRPSRSRSRPRARPQAFARPCPHMPAFTRGRQQGYFVTSADSSPVRAATPRFCTPARQQTYPRHEFDARRGASREHAGHGRCRALSYPAVTPIALRGRHYLKGKAFGNSHLGYGLTQRVWSCTAPKLPYAPYPIIVLAQARPQRRATARSSSCASRSRGSRRCGASRTARRRT